MLGLQSRPANLNSSIVAEEIGARLKFVARCHACAGAVKRAWQKRKLRMAGVWCTPGNELARSLLRPFIQHAARCASATRQFDSPGHSCTVERSYRNCFRIEDNH